MNSSRKILVLFLAGFLWLHQNMYGTQLCNIAVTTPNHRTLELAEPVFSFSQMEKEPPKLAWKKISDITFQTTLDKKVAGEDLAGVQLTRTIRHLPNRIQIQFKLENKTDEMRYASFGFRSCFQLGKDGTDRMYIPTENNVLDLDHHSSLWGYYTKPGEWHFNMVEPWTAILSHSAKTGLGCVVDYHILSAGYVCDDMQKRGFMFDGGLLPPGKTFSTDILILPLKNMSNVCHVSPQFSVGFSGKGPSVVLEIMPYADTKIDGKASVTNATGKSLGRRDFSFDGKALQLRQLPMTIAAPHTQTVNQAIINGHHIEQYRENGFRTTSLPMVPPKFTHTRTAPQKTNPVHASTSYSQKRQDKALLVFGFYANFFRFEKILTGYQITTIPAIPQGIQNIPPAITMNQYRFIILGDVNVESLRPMITRLNSYVKNGGILVVCGGPFAFGCGGYANSYLEKLLPVTSTPFDLRPAAGDEVYNQPVDFTLDSPNPPQLWWIHKTALKPHANVLMKAQQHPLLVSNNVGKGTVIAFLGTPLGNPRQDERPWWNERTYVDLMKNILSKVAGKEIRQ